MKLAFTILTAGPLWLVTLPFAWINRWAGHALGMDEI